MKKLLSFVAALLLVFSFAGCGEYTGPSGPGTVVDPGTPSHPSTPGDGEGEEGQFKVSLVLYDEATGYTTPFVSEYNDKIFAQWSDLENNNVFRTRFGADGVARRSGLDGDYRITLTAAPEGYTYDPNIYTADNDNRDVEIVLYKLNTYTGTGLDRYKPIEINNEGVYRITVSAPDQEIFFVYTPSKNGVYSVESMLDVTANEINPKLYDYGGSRFYVEQLQGTYDDGGVSNTYTKNFKCSFSFLDSNIGASKVFSVVAQSTRQDAFPVDIDFKVIREGSRTEEGKDYPSYPVDESAGQVATPSGSRYYIASLNSSKLLGYQDVVKSVDGKTVKECVKLEIEEGEDGFYYFTDAQTGVKRLIYSTIHIDNEVLTTESHKGFADGYVTPIVTKLNGKNYAAFLQHYQDLSYNGYYPVTAALREFLQSFSQAQAYFRDGNGWAETESGYNSSEENQWLWSCAYFA